MSLEEIKRLIDEKKRKILELRRSLELNKRSAIDQYTQIDEILRQLLQEQQITNEQLSITNKLLYAIYLMGGVGGEGKGEIPKVDLSELGSNRFRTKVVHLSPSGNIGTQRIFKVEGAGYVEEVKFISSNSSANNKSYSVRVIADDSVIYDATWDEYESRSLHETDVTAFNDTNNSVYVLHFRNIFYVYNFTVEIYDNLATFQNVYVKYHEEI